MRMNRHVAMLAILAQATTSAWAGSPTVSQVPVETPASKPPAPPRAPRADTEARPACAAWERMIPINPTPTPLHIGLKTYPQT